MTDTYRMTGMDKEIFNATRTLTSLLNDACNHWNYLRQYLEKLAIVADDALRGYQKDYPEQVAELIDYRRKRELPGNAAAMREALEYMLDFDATDDAAMDDGITDAERIMEYADHIAECQKKARAALSAPPRQCDMGTAEEQRERLKAFCRDRQHGSCDGCPIPKKGFCTLQWAQTPYEAQKGAWE